MAYTNQLLQDILDAMPDTAGLNRETTQQAIQAILNGLATENKVEAVRSLLQSIYDDCCPTQHLQDILDAMPAGGDYALETSMQTSLTRLQSILDRITSVEADLGYDALLDPLDTQKKSLDDVQDKLQDILDAMPDIASLMTDAKGEAIRALLQSIYDDCCPNTLLTSIKNNTYDSKNHLGNIAADSSYQTIRLAEIRDRVALETTLQSILGALPSTSGLALDATLEQVRINTSHLDQIESSLDIIRSELLAIKDCVCAGGVGGCTPCPDEDSEFSDKDPEYEGDDVETNPPPDDYSSWSERNRSICRRANWLLEQMIKDAGKASDLISAIGQIGTTITGAITTGKAVKGLASEGVVTLAKKGLTAKGWIPISAYVSLITLATGFVWSVIKSDIEWVRCELVNVIYQNRKQGSAACHEAWDLKVDERFQPFSATNWALKLWVWDTSFEIIYQPEMWSSEAAAGDPDGIPLTMEPCLCYDAPADWHNPDLMFHTHDSLRDMTTSGSDVVSWNNTGAAGGAFVVSSGANPAQYSGDAVILAPGRKMQGPGGRFDAMYMVLEITPPTDRARSVMIQNGQDSYKPYIEAQTTPRLQLQLRGRDYLYTPIPAGRVVLGMRADPGDGRTYYTLNGAALGDAAPSGSPGAYPPLMLGSITAAYGANYSVWAIVGYSLNNTLTAAQETDIVNNLMSLYPV
jgi:hypothetical protein